MATIGISTTVAALGTRSVSAGSTGRSQALGLVVVIHCRRVRDSVRVEVNDHHRCKVRAAANERHRLEVRVVVPEHHKGKVKTDANATVGSAFLRRLPKL